MTGGHTNGRTILTRRASKAEVTPAQRALGVELKRVRTEVLKLYQPKMAAWLFSAERDGANEKSTGKSLVAMYESGRETPSLEVLQQYGRAGGSDVERLRRLWTDVVDEADKQDTRPPRRDDSDGTTRTSWLRRNRWWVIGAAAVLVVAVAIGGVALKGGDEAPHDPATVRGVHLVFDARGARSDQTIDVYPGTKLTTADRTSDLSYHNGASAAVVCKTQGRRVTTHPEAGERPGSSTVWIGIRTTNGRLRLATLAYARLVPAAAAVPSCTSVP